MLDALQQKGVPQEIFTDGEKAKAWAKANRIEIERGAGLGKILDEIFKEKVEPELVQPTFITDHPVELSPLAKRKPGNPALVERFEFGFDFARFFFAAVFVDAEFAVLVLVQSLEHFFGGRFWFLRLRIICGYGDRGGKSENAQEGSQGFHHWFGFR
jgi:hypothetical protein